MIFSDVGSFYHVHPRHDSDGFNACALLCIEGGSSLFAVLGWILSLARWKVWNFGFCNHYLLQIFTK